MKLYHLTTPENALRIKREGLIPQLGVHRALCREAGNVVCLCQAKDVPYWAKLLELGALFSVESEDLDPAALSKYFRYELYGEYRYSKPIPPELLTRRQMFKPLTQEAENELCESYMASLHLICWRFARYYLSPFVDKEFKERLREYLAGAVPATLYSAKKLNFAGLTAPRARAAIREFSKTEYTFADRLVVEEYEWERVGKEMPEWAKVFAERTAEKKSWRLYQALKKYPPDEFTALRKELYELIVRTFRSMGCLNINAGEYWPN